MLQPPVHQSKGRNPNEKEDILGLDLAERSTSLEQKQRISKSVDGSQTVIDVNNQLSIFSSS